MQIQDALDRFLLQLDADGRSPHTIAQYKRHVLMLANWAATDGPGGALADLDEHAVARFFTAPVAKLRAQGGPRKATAANALRTSVRVFLGHCHEAGLIARNPARLLRRAVCSSPPPKAFSDDDLKRLMTTLDGASSDADRRDAVLFRFLLHAGVRISSALALQIGDLDLVEGSALLRSAKRGRDDRIVLGQAAVALLRDWLGERQDRLVFGEIGTRHAQRRLALWLARAVITRHYSLHSFRHTFATALYAKTGDVLLVKEALRHRNVGSTLVYASCAASRVREALGA